MSAGWLAPLFGVTGAFRKKRVTRVKDSVGLRRAYPWLPVRRWSWPNGLLDTVWLLRRPARQCPVPHIVENKPLGR